MAIVGTYTEPTAALKSGEPKTVLQFVAPAHMPAKLRSVAAQFPEYPGVPERVVIAKAILTVELQSGGVLANMGLPARRVSGVDRPGEPLLGVYRSVVREEPESVKVLAEVEADIHSGTIVGADLPSLPLTVPPGGVVGIKLTCTEDLTLGSLTAEHEE